MEDIKLHVLHETYEYKVCKRNTISIVTNSNNSYNIRQKSESLILK